MKWFRRILLIAGFAAALVMLWNLDARAVGRMLAHVGWGIAAIVALEIGPYVLNTIGWQLSFTALESRAYSFRELFALWTIGEGVNYLVPSATIAGEVTRVTMLDDTHSTEVRAASVVIARIGATFGQVLYLLLGFAFLIERVKFLRENSWITTTAGWLLLLLGIGFAAYMATAGRWIATEPREEHPIQARLRWLKAMPGRMRVYFGKHPLRFGASVAVFGAAYAWGAIEAYWICWFLGLPITIAKATSIEVLSVAIDGALFFIPAKIGTQEVGKTAIFSLLGLPPASGFAFGVVRHIRELVWALLGFGMYAGRKSGARGTPT